MGTLDYASMHFVWTFALSPFGKMEPCKVQHRLTVENSLNVHLKLKSIKPRKPLRDCHRGHMFSAHNKPIENMPTDDLTVQNCDCL